MKRRIVSPEEFILVFLKVVENREEELLQLWERPAKEFTRFMLGTNPNDGLLRIIADKEDGLGLRYYREYYTLDAIFYEGEVSNKNIFPYDKTGTYAKCLSIALEHEMNIKASYEEMNKLCIFDAPLKVLITYPKDRENIKEVIKNYSIIVSEADVFVSQKHMVIFGLKENDKIKWESYVYEDGEFSLKS